MQAGANASALRVPFQGAACTGARQRKSPTGGAAKGIPLKKLSPFADTPDIVPDSVRTCCATAAVARLAAAASTHASFHRFCNWPFFQRFLREGAISDFRTFDLVGRKPCYLLNPWPLIIYLLAHSR